MNSYDGKVTWKVTIPVSLMCILSLVTFITPVHAAVGDLILDTEILLPDFHFINAENTTKSSTLLKEGYSIFLDRMRWLETSQGKEICVTNYSIFKNGDVVKRIRVIGNDYFCYNKTIDGKEYTIIEASVDSIFVGIGTDIVKLEPFRQYSDGSVIVEPDFITASLNPYTNETPPEEWNRTFGGVYDDFGRYGQSVQQTLDGGYILIGLIESYTPGMSSMYTHYAFLIKTDTKGNEEWNRTFEDIGLQNAYSVQQTSDGGYILGGAVRSYPNWRRETDAMLVKTDSNGDIVWHKTTGALGNDDVMSVRQTYDGGYILAGFSYSDRDHAWLIKTDVNGKQEWNRTFGSDFFDTVYSIEQTLDGGYLLAGSVNSNDTGYCECLVKTDANGSEQWNRTIGSGLIARISSICQSMDGGCVLAGKIDTAKNPEFKGQILYDDDDAWLFKTDADGNLEWSKTFGGLKNDEAGFVEQTSDGGYIIAGITESYGAGGSDLWLVKVAGMEVDFVQPSVSANNTSIEEVRLSDNNVTETLQSPPGKSIPGFGFVGAVFSVSVMLLSRRRIF